MKLLTSIEVDVDELNAFKLGEEAKINNVLKRELVEKVKNESNEDNTEWMLNYLSWMISEGILDIRITLNKNNIKNIYHDKVSFITDEDSCVCIHGSLNDSRHALRNQESIDMFVSWVEREKKRIDMHRKQFDKAWNGHYDDFIILELPDIVKLEFEKLKSNFNPYNYIIKQKTGIRDYQLLAIDYLQQSNWRGILSMATGTGKTLTSLFAVDRYLELNKKAVICIVVPQLHLLYQWSNIIQKKYNTNHLLICAELKEKWGSNLFRIIQNFSRSNSNKFFILTTYKTLIDDSFQNALLRCKSNLVYIFDECHKLGSAEIIRKLRLLENSARVGLSATPNRWLDNTGNAFLEKAIGKIVYEFSLEEAIKKKFLAEYEYHICLVELTTLENEEYLKLTSQIKQKSNINDEKFETNEVLKRLLNDRARLVKKAENKKEEFFKVFSMNEEKKHSIVYVFDEQVKSMVEEIKQKFNLIVYGIIASTTISERNKILKGFNDGEIDVVVAIQCLDEGVDIPNCKSAYILASSTNPREFVQRRGRVLRLPDKNQKKLGRIYDFVTIAPESNMIDDENKVEVIKRELPRVAEFNRLAKNKNADYCIIDYLANLNSLYIYAEQDPWKINSSIAKEEEVNE